MVHPDPDLPNPSPAPLDDRALFTPPPTLAALFLVLTKYADPNYVQNHADYLTLFLLGGAASLALAQSAARWLGFDLKDDALERRNPAAAVAIIGIVLACMTAYAGANIGAGPTIWTTLVPAFLATTNLASSASLCSASGRPSASAATPSVVSAAKSPSLPPPPANHRAIFLSKLCRL